MKKTELTESNSPYQEAMLQKLRKMCLMDDVFMTKVFDDHNESIELVLQIIMDKVDLKIVRSETQVFASNLLKKSVRFDVLATDDSGKMYNIEVQQADKGASRKRARYNSSMMDSKLLDKGGDFEELPETYVIFITENDVLQHGHSVYHIERKIEEDNELFGDEEHILYVNGTCRDDSPIGKLMFDFFCTDPDKMNYKILADRTRYFKETEKGREKMSSVMDELIAEGVELGKTEGFKKLLLNVKSLMENTNWPLEKTMELMNVSEDQRKYILENIKNE